MNTNADQNARQKALDPRMSFIVQAPAGSGKTELLTQRYLKLLALTPNNPEEIIAITFTKKASAEMRERILNALQGARLPKPELPHKQITWQLAKTALSRDDKEQWHILDNPNRLRIMTIDALSLTINQFAPLLGELGSQPAIIDDPAELYQQAAASLFANLDNSPIKKALSALLLHLDNRVEHTVNLLAFMLQKREQWLPYVIGQSHDISNLRHQLELSLRQVSTDALIEMDLCFPPPLRNKIVFCAQQAGAYLQEHDPVNPLNILNEIHHTTETTYENMPLWLAIANMLMTAQGQWRKTLSKRQGFAAKSELKATALELIAELQGYPEALTSLQSLRYCPSAEYEEPQWDILQDLLVILPVLVANLRVIMQSHGGIDFSEITLAALRALGYENNPTDLALYLDHTIHHLLIDEFQDTSAIQFSLFEKLLVGWQPNDGRTLFLVGDPMQSIYRFRNAEVSLFLHAKDKGINQIQLHFLQLNVNFRSDNHIVNWINSTFTHVLPPKACGTTGAIPYTPAIAASSQGLGNIQYYTSRDNPHTLHQAIVNTINSIPNNESIAILVRSRKQLSQLIPVLHTASIKFSAVEIEPLSHCSEIQDCVSLTKALLHRADIVAWLSCLRAPWCGLTLHDLFILSQACTSTLFATLQQSDAIHSLSEDGQLRLPTFINAMLYGVKNAGRIAFSQLVESVWNRLGGPLTLSSEQAAKNVDAYFSLLNNIEKKYHTITLSRIDREINKLYADSQQHDPQIQIMTIHKSKGLEFDHVILPHLEAKGANNDNNVLQWLERPDANGKIHLLLAPIKCFGSETDGIYQYLQHTEKQKLEQETARLLYVACTRAKKSLHLCANIKNNDDDINCNIIKAPPKGSHLALLWRTLDAQFSNNILPDDTLTPALTADTSSSTKLIRITDQHFTKNTIQPSPISLTQHFHKPITITQPEEQTARLVGTITHNALQNIAEQNLSSWEEVETKKLPTQWARQLKQNGIHTDANLNAIIEATKNTLNCETGQWILSNDHSFSASEYPLSANIENNLINITIDRMIVTENTVWVIDFKTSQPTDQFLHDFIEHEIAQYRSQLSLYHQIVSTTTSLPVKCALYFPLCEQKWAEVDVMHAHNMK